MVTAGEVDGRRARSERSRAAIVDAFLGILPTASRRPTVEEIASKAGVSERSVYRHFPDVDALVRAAVDRRVEVMAPLAELRCDPEAPLNERVERLTSQRATFYEAALPLRRFTDQAVTELDTLADLGRARRVFLRDQLLAVFGADLERLDGRRPRAQDALEAAACWATWQHLREEQELSVDEARTVVTTSVLAILAEPGGP